MAVTGAHKIEALYKKAAGLRIDKSKVKAISDVVDQKLYDLLVVAEGNARYNNRDVIWMCDVPLTKAMKESMQKFKDLEEELELQPILDHLATLPPLKYALEEELEKKLPDLTGTLIYVMANITKEFSPKDKIISKDDMERAERILNLMI
ncbi:MAG: DUF1931 family protein [Thermodesulfobacteria bacterium]|nr:DUF1931 family protein [Thermodesulfobacteriota bacterium]